MSFMNKKEMAEFSEKSKEIHAVWHKFSAWLEDEFGKDWRSELVGYDAMLKIEAYVKTNPEISLSYCDDEMFAGSMLVIVPHKGMGNTVIYVPQLTTITNQFFLYPNHQALLIEALNKNNHSTAP